MCIRDRGSLDRNFTGLDSVLGPADVLSARLASLRNGRFGTERLVLRPLRLEDAADMFEYTSDPETSRFLNWAPHGEPGEARDWIASKLARPEPDDLLLGIEHREPRKLIGTVRAYRFDAAACSCEVSYACLLYTSMRPVENPLRARLRLPSDENVSEDVLR